MDISRAVGVSSAMRHRLTEHACAVEWICASGEARGVEHLHLVTYDLTHGKYTDHGYRMLVMVATVGLCKGCRLTP